MPVLADSQRCRQLLGSRGDKKLAVFIAFGHGNKAVKDVLTRYQSPSNVKMVTHENRKHSLRSSLLFSNMVSLFNMELYTELEDVARCQSAVAISLANRPYK